MDQDTFNELADIALKASGQVIPASKVYLVEARLANIARRVGLASMADLVGCLKARPNPVLEAEVGAALASHDTRFFRNRASLKHAVETFLPMRAENAQAGKLRIWCAGGASGQEAYSLAILLGETKDGPLTDLQIDIVSTDFCSEVTDRARSGLFSHFEVQKGLSIQRLLKHFKRQENEQWQISEKLRSRISFRKHNLLEDMNGLGSFDLIFCRNVFTNLARSVHRDIAERLGAQLVEGGLLVLGEGETLIGITEALQPDPDVRCSYVSVTKSDATQAA